MQVTKRGRMVDSAVRITIQTENDAFTGDNRGHEIARILRRLADRFETGAEPTKVMDVNGNCVGTVENVQP